MMKPRNDNAIDRLKTLVGEKALRELRATNAKELLETFDPEDFVALVEHLRALCTEMEEANTLQNRLQSKK